MNIRIFAGLLISIAALAACSSDGGTGGGTSGSGTPSGSSSSSSSSSSFTCCVNKAFYKCGTSADMDHCAQNDMTKYCPRDSSQDDKCK